MGISMRCLRGVSVAVAVAAGCAISLTAPASASEIYSLPGGTTADQNWSGSLGLDFTVNSDVVVYGLGAFYDNGDPITVAIYQTDASNSSGTLVASTTIAAALSPYTFQAVTPVLLTPGYYQVAAWGYGSGTGNYNTGNCGGGYCPALNFNSLGNELGFGLPWFNFGTTGFAYQDQDDNYGNSGPYGNEHYYGAGNFEAFATPLPSTWTMLIAGFIALGFFAYRGSKKNSALQSPPPKLSRNRISERPPRGGLYSLRSRFRVEFS
jgi:hypothetical protein